MEFPVQKYELVFRLVEETDAALILALRTDPALSTYMSTTEVDLQKQIEWLRKYKEREKNSEEFYFVYSDHHRDLGVFRLYNIDHKNRTLTSGSWLAWPNPGDELSAFKADLFLTTTIFETLKFERCIIDIRRDNRKLIRYHQMFFKQFDEDEQHLYLVMDRNSYQRKHHFLTNIIEPTNNYGH